MQQRLDEAMVERGLAQSRSQAANLIKLGKVLVGERKAKKPGQRVIKQNSIAIVDQEVFVARSGFKLASANQKFEVEFKGKTVLDVGSSTGGFTDYSLKRGAKKVVAVDVGTNQLHQNLQNNPKVELHEKTDIRDFKTDQVFDIILVDVSFISLKKILPKINKFMNQQTVVIVLFKPQFEAGPDFKHKGVIKNERMRRDLIKDFENWIKQNYALIDKLDSPVIGSKGNVERVYQLAKLN